MSRVCSPRTVSGVARARTLHNNAVYNNTTAGPREREPHHTLALAAPPQQRNTRSPQTTLHYPGQNSAAVSVSVLVLVKPTHACFRTNTSSSSNTPEPGGAYCLLTSHNTTAQFSARHQTQRQLGLLYVTTFHFYIAKYVASSGGASAKEQPNIFCPHP